MLLTSYIAKQCNASRHSGQLRLFILAVLFPLLLGVSVEAGAQTAGDKVKAALVYKFSKFVHWSEDQSAVTGADFNICVLGDTPIGDLLENLEGNSIRGTALRVNQIEHVDQAGSDCHVMFISGSAASGLSNILKGLQNFSVLTISDIKGFADEGGMIELAIIKRRLVFIINLDSVLNSGLRVDAPLLEVANQVIQNKKNRPTP